MVETKTHTPPATTHAGAKPITTTAKSDKKGKNAVAGHKVSIIGVNKLKVGGKTLKKGEHYDLKDLDSKKEDLEENPNVVVEPVNDEGNVVEEKEEEADEEEEE